MQLSLIKSRNLLVHEERFPVDSGEEALSLKAGRQLVEDLTKGG
jgi:hypothetical protein